MTTRKKAQTNAPRKPTPAELRRQLARDLASVLRNPECPVMLFNDIADRVTDMSSDLNWYSAEQIERSLNAHIQKEAARKGGR
jgi:hypothetical protein